MAKRPVYEVLTVDGRLGGLRGRGGCQGGLVFLPTAQTSSGKQTRVPITKKKQTAELLKCLAGMSQDELEIVAECAGAADPEAMRTVAAILLPVTKNYE